ncbi:DNA-3-methyladenine glycosylase 2 family protein [Neptunicella marina]|uniref:DNA-3-methyladenine glycosylase 2 family protein n=1 Tax=Neptunicella marina TaxID=2125989 RepID=A0A8J6IUG8_9ALTE|nr:AlkA N-terminal domain-containing protein [Neptunicella marina]MBC3766559.1 DNA-3-methyladenine glycosylase 2 family protein [Neptunicella marina]
MCALSHYQQARLTRDPRFDGQFFIAVKSTGIFCRPVCPARLPKESNVEYFELASQALEHGYRPCLRCRPDSAPHSYAWKGIDTTVERALRLLSDYPHLSIENIAEKLGISDRYLRKLFKSKIGLTAKQFQLNQQLLFAKKLLQETTMSVEQVAQSTGLQSARRLQELMQRSLRLTPRQLRRKASNVPTGIIVLEMPYRPPYCWAHMRDFLARRAVAGSEWVDEKSYARLFRFAQTQGWFKATHQPQRNSFSLEIELTDLSCLKPLLANIRRLFDLDADMSVIEQQLLKTGFPVDKLLHGLRLPGVWSAFEAGCRAVLGQQVSVTAAINQLILLVDTLGEQTARGKLFPTAEQIKEADLSFLRMPNARRETLKALAGFCVEQPDADVQQWLSIKGIGPWTVDYTKMRGLSNPDIYLGGDLVIKKQTEHMQFEADNAAPWRSYLTLQLWNQA